MQLVFTLRYTNWRLVKFKFLRYVSFVFLYIFSIKMYWETQHPIDFVIEAVKKSI